MLRDLYDGKVIPWERHNRCNAEQQALIDKIVADEKYFAEKLTPEDCQRFKELAELYTNLSI